MAEWDAAEEAIMNAACKVWAAFAVAWPSLSYASGTWVTLDIDGTKIPCQCDCTGLLIATITYMGYDASHWPVGSHNGFGCGLAEATTNFIYNSDGTLSSDWELSRDTSITPKAGDIRGEDSTTASNASHADMFVGYDGDKCRGLNGGSSDGMKVSAAVAKKYLETGGFDITQAAGTIQDGNYTSVLRYVKGSDSPATGSGGSHSSSTSQSLNAVDIELTFIERISFTYSIRNETGEFNDIIPGFRPNRLCYPTDDGTQADDSYGDSWLEFIALYTIRWANNSMEDWEKEVKAGLVMQYTLDNSDPLLYGRTIVLNEDGTNNYAASENLAPIIKAQFPVHFRCVITDVATHSQDFGRSSAIFTNQSAVDYNSEISNIVKSSKNLSFLTDASDKIPEAEDAHGYLFLHDEDTEYSREEHSSWVQGRDEK